MLDQTSILKLMTRKVSYPRGWGERTCSQHASKRPPPRYVAAPTELLLVPETSRRHTAPPPVPVSDGDARVDWRTRLLTLTGIDLHVCPICRLRTIVQRPLPIPVGRAPPEAA